jgi:hypothetical protein
MFRKGGRTHVVPLPPLALGVLKDLRPVTGKAPWVFVGKRGASLASNPGRFAEFVRETAGLDFKLHDLRRTCATGCARLGASESTVSRILGHKAIAGTIAVSGIYDRFDRLPEIRAALTAWSGCVEALVGGEKEQGEVVDFGRAAGDRAEPGRRRWLSSLSTELGYRPAAASSAASDGRRSFSFRRP